MAARRLGYAWDGRWVGCVKGMVCKWLRRTAVPEPQLSGRSPELDGLWTRTRAGRTELKVIHNATGVALRSKAPRAAVIDRAWQLGSSIRCIR